MNLTTKYANPFKKWLMTQPRAVTQSALAKQLDCNQSYVSDLMGEGCRILPSLTLAMKIEDITNGKVTPRAMYEFAMKNRARLGWGEAA